MHQNVTSPLVSSRNLRSTASHVSQSAKCRCSTSEAPPLTAELHGSAGASVQVSASLPQVGSPGRHRDADQDAVGAPAHLRLHQRLAHDRAHLRGEALLEVSGHDPPPTPSPGIRDLDPDPEARTGPPGDHDGQHSRQPRRDTPQAAGRAGRGPLIRAARPRPRSRWPCRGGACTRPTCTPPPGTGRSGVLDPSIAQPERARNRTDSTTRAPGQVPTDAPCRTWPGMPTTWAAARPSDD
jgi:hypothetical protein